MTIFCTSCRGSKPAIKRRGVLPGNGLPSWFNVCCACRTQHPAPPPDQAARNHRQRAIVRRRQQLERNGQTTLFPKGDR